MGWLAAPRRCRSRAGGRLVHLLRGEGPVSTTPATERELYMPAEASLVLTGKAERMLAEIAGAEDAVRVERLAEAARVLARQMNLGIGAINYATVVKERAMRRLADVVDAGQRGGEIAAHGGDRGKIRDPDLASPQDLGVKAQRLHEARQIRDAFTDEELIRFGREHTDREKLLAHGRVLRVARDRAAKERKKRAAVLAILPPTIEIRLGDFREVLNIEPGTVDAVITDPPYPEKYLPLWSDLAECAARWLRPGGLVVALSGQTHLPAVITRLGEHLEYWWCGALVTSGPNYVSQARRVHSGFKPLLFYVRKGDKPSVRIADTIHGDGSEKQLHPWQQNLAAYVAMVERFSVSGALVIDPFVGAGTTALACQRLGRSFLGAEIEPDTHRAALERFGG
jgi:16S rRNA G966 N2-methylase RsmD